MQTEAEDIASGGLLMYQNSDRAVKNGTPLELGTPATEFDKVLYAPVRFTVENLGGEVTWNNEEQAAFIMFGDKTHKLKEGKSAVCVDGSPVEIAHPIRNHNGSMYIAAADLETIMNVPVYQDLGFLMIDGEEQLYQNAVDLVRDEVKNMIKYPRPNGEELYSALMTRFSDNAHPRLHGGAADFERIKQYIQTDSVMQGMFSYIKNWADPVLNTPVTEWAQVMDKRDEAFHDRPIYLGFMYRITGDEKYAERCWEEMEQACNIQDWHEPQNPNDPYAKDADTLSNMNILTGMAFGYDWIYDWMSEDQRKLAEETMMKRSMEPFMKAFKGEILRTSGGGWAYWIDDPLNFNPAVNEALITASIALAEVYPEFCAEMMEYVVRSLECHYNFYEPDGAWIEGPDYGYSTLNSTCAIANLLETAFGTDCGFANVPGLTEAAYYYQYVLGPSGFFNFSDAGKQTQPRYSFSFYLADKLKDTDIGYFRKIGLEESNYITAPEEMFYYDPALIGDSVKSLELDRFYRGVETAFLRSSWDDDAIFAGLHSDYNRQQHGHLDMGTFVIDAMGEEWICDHRYDPWHYSYMDYLVYRTRAEGHSTIVIDDTPYSLSKTEDGYINYKNYTFEDYDIGYQLPQGVATDEFRPTYGGTGSITIVQDPDNPDNRYAMMSGKATGEDAGSSGIQLNLPETFYSKYQISFKAKWEDFSDYEDASNHNGKFPEINSSKGSSTADGFYFPFRLDSAGVLRGNVGGNERIMLEEFKTDVWYQFTIQGDLNTQTYSLYVDGGEEGGYAEIVGVNASKVPDFTGTRFNARTNIHFDDFELKLDPTASDMALTAARRDDQYRYANAKIDKFETKARGAYAITDMSEAFPTQAVSAVRGLMLGENRSAVIIRDEIKLKKKSDVHWFAQMNKLVDVEVAEDGKSAILTRNGKKMWVGILSDVDAVIERKDAVPMPGSPNPPEQLANTDIHKLAIVAEGVMELNLSVAFVPLGAGETAPAKIPQEVALADWSIPDGEMPKLTGLTVDGAPIDGFDVNKTYYNVMLYDDAMNRVPVVSATADAGTNVSITQATSVPGSAVITVEKDGITKTYTIGFDGKVLKRGVIRGQEITELDITASRWETEDSAPIFIFDNDFTTRWCSYPKNQWIQIDLHNTVEMSDLDIAWYQGAERNYAFQILVSENGVDWNIAFDGKSSGKSDQYETFVLNGTYNARYIRVVCNGHATGEYNNISEIR
ncbi:MAG: hypothetical protein E7409_03620 [Ruminococcaceae bacterium]|nr:hypothetical protein [Oscillospiraceae bacterium]